MKLKILNEGCPILPSHKEILHSLFSDKPLSSIALEPKDDVDEIEELEDAVEDSISAPRFGRSSNYTRLNTNGEDDVRGGK